MNKAGTSQTLRKMKMSTVFLVQFVGAYSVSTKINLLTIVDRLDHTLYRMQTEYTLDTEML